MMKQYWKYHIWEMLILWFASFSALLTFSQGFYIPDHVADSIVIAGIVNLVVLGCCYLGNYKKQTMILFLIAYVVAVVAYILFLTARGIDIVDEEGSSTSIYIYIFAAMIMPVVMFFMSRFRIGIALIFLIGVYLYALNDFLDFEAKTWRLVLFVMSVIALYLLRQYRVQALKNSTIDPDFTKFSASDAVTVVVSLLLSILLFFLLIQPIAPPTMDLKLLTKYMDYQVLEMIGIADKYQLPDDYRSETENDEEVTTNQQEQTDEEDYSQETEAQQNDEGVDAPDSGNSEEPEALSSVTYEKDYTWVIVILIILLILLIASIPFLRILYRKKKLEKLRTGSYREQIIGMYQFYENKFSRIGFARPGNQTELEYVKLFDERLDAYLAGAMGIREMTAAYIRARYGALENENDAEICEKFAAVYPALLKNYRLLHGRFRYLLKFFVL